MLIVSFVSCKVGICMFIYIIKKPHSEIPHRLQFLNLTLLAFSFIEVNLSLLINRIDALRKIQKLPALCSHYELRVSSLLLPM